jgi:outer membrane phospholipase A
MASAASIVRIAGAAALVSGAFSLAFERTARAQDDLYFEAVRTARDGSRDDCDGKTYICYDLLSTHRLNYILSGVTGSTEVKFQFSVKYNLWPNESPSSVHLGYTQKSKWDLYRVSAPFLETNYDPEIFYTYDFRGHGTAHTTAQSPSSEPSSSKPPSTGGPLEGTEVEDLSPPPDVTTRCAISYLRGGVEHESNGLGDQNSRAWNRAYASGLGGCDLTAAAYVVAGLKVWAPPLFIASNPDISKYLGSGELSLSVGVNSDAWYGAFEIAAVARKGWRASWKAGDVEVDARWRPGYASLSTAWRFVPYLFGQMYTGYGETLLDYNNPETSFRIGIGLSGSVRLRR